jgi:hypothetical protein
MKRVVWPLAVVALLVAAHWALGAVLVRQEPLAAVLTGRYWVAAIAVALLVVRLAIFFAAAPWALYRVLFSLADRAKAHPHPDRR